MRLPNTSTLLYIGAMTETLPERSTKIAMLRGFRRRCPNCGEGAMFEGYLKVTHSCSVCGQVMGNHRADDGPAYLTILVVGHLMAPLLHIVYFNFRPSPWVTITIFGLGCLASSLYLLPRLKGAVVGYQWAHRMHGFADDGP